MQFFHGSRDGGILELTTSHSKDGYVYATSSRLVALTYVARSFPNLFTSINDRECFLEVKSNIFEKMTKNKSGYIYLLEAKDFEPVPQGPRCGHKCCYRIKENVKVVSKECIEDAYEELLKYVKSGEFKIVHEDEMPQEKKERIVAQISGIAKSLSEEELNSPNNSWKIFLQ